MGARKLNAGEWVEVLSREEILRTLDADGRLDGMPFMPEMFAFCGQRFKVHKRAHKACDTVFPVRGRRVDAAVHLDTRCDGSAHGGCEAGCLLFWKQAWVKRVDPNGPQGLVQVTPATGSAGCTEERVRAAASGAEGGYVCQATQLPYCSKHLSPWDIRQYVEDYESGNVGLWRILRAFGYSAYYHLSQSGLGLGGPMRGLYNAVHRRWRGTLWPEAGGRIAKGQPVPVASLNLQPGEMVRVKSHEEILATVNTINEHRGLRWDAEMVPYCGGTYKVARRVNRILDERTGKMLDMKSPCIVLEGVLCEAKYSRCRFFCPRAITPYWREVWLERVGQP